MTLIWYQSHHHKSSRAVVNTLVWWPVALTTGWWPVFVVDNSPQPTRTQHPTNSPMCSLDCNDYLDWTWSEWEMKTISSQCKHCRRRWKWRENRRRNHEAFPRLGHSHILTITNILLNGIAKPQLRKYPDICILWQLWGEMVKGAMRTFSQESGKLQLLERWTCWAVVEEIFGCSVFLWGVVVWHLAKRGL